MSAASALAPGQSAVPPALSVAPRPRRNTRMLLLGVLAVCLGALASVGIYVNTTQASSVIRITRAVPRGAVVEAADLGVVSLPRTPGVATVAAGELAGLVGQEALSDLAEGALLAPGSIGRSAVGSGTVHVGLKLAAGRIPARSIPVAAGVLLIAVPPAGNGSAPGATPAPTATLPSFHAVVVTAPSLLPDGSQVLDVSVAAESAAQVAQLAAADRLVVVREGER